MIRRSTSQSLRPLEGRELKEAKKFKYLGSAVLIEEEVKVSVVCGVAEVSRDACGHCRTLGSLRF